MPHCSSVNRGLRDSRSSEYGLHGLWHGILLLKLSKLPIDEADVAFIFEDLHRGRSVVYPYDIPSRPVLLKWNENEPLCLENCVVMDNREADLHTKEGPERWDETTRETVKRRQQDARNYRSWIM